MTQAELIAAFRSEADDTVAASYLWPDSEVITFLNAAEAEACERANLLVETSNATYCDIDLAIDSAFYQLHDQVLIPKRISLDNSTLVKTTREKLDVEVPDWETETGTPTKYIHTGRYIQVYPIPEATGTLNMIVSRLPVEMDAAGPEIPSRYHLKLITWCLFLAFSKKDADIYSESYASVYENRFANYFGSMQSANVQEQQLTQRPETPDNRPGWF